jgi:hypothetical protein
MLRTCVLCCAVAGLVGLAVGCNNGSSSGTTKRDEAAKAAKVTLDDLDKKAAALKEKAEKATGDEKAKLEARVKDAGAKREPAAKKVDELKAAAGDKWEAAKKDTDAALDEYKKAIE